MADCGIRRRRLLTAGAATGLAGLGGLAAGRTRAFGQTQVAGAMKRSLGLIDVHHHIRPPGAPPQLMKLMPDWSAAKAVEEMDSAGVATGIAWPGPIHGQDAQARRQAARTYNEFGATLGQDNRGRFGLFASLPFPDVEGCIAEIDFALDHLHADGFGIATSYGDLWLGDRSFWPIYEKLNSRDAVVFVHPFDASCCAPASMTYMQAVMDGSWIEWPMNTARTILSLMVTGTLRQYPRVRFIFCHGGGVMPLLVNRIAGLAAWKNVGPDGLKTLFPDGIESEFKRLYFECAQACSHPNMDALRTLVPDSNIMFGSDFPFFPIPYASANFRELGFSTSTAEAIGRGNAAAMLPRWA